MPLRFDVEALNSATEELGAQKELSVKQAYMSTVRVNLPCDIRLHGTKTLISFFFFLLVTIDIRNER